MEIRAISAATKNDAIRISTAITPRSNRSEVNDSGSIMFQGYDQLTASGVEFTLSPSQL
jgi:hypothetical protein